MSASRGVWQVDGHLACFQLRYGIAVVDVACPHPGPGQGAGAADMPACLVGAGGEPVPECIVAGAADEFGNEELWDMEVCKQVTPRTNPFPVMWRLDRGGVYLAPALIGLEDGSAGLGAAGGLADEQPCPKPCDADCQAYCHELHDPPWKRTDSPAEHYPRVAALADAYVRLVAQHQETAALLAESGRSRERLVQELAFERRETERATGNWNFAARRYQELKAENDDLKSRTAGVSDV